MLTLLVICASAGLTGVAWGQSSTSPRSRLDSLLKQGQAIRETITQDFDSKLPTKPSESIPRPLDLDRQRLDSINNRLELIGKLIAEEKRSQIKPLNNNPNLPQPAVDQGDQTSETNGPPEIAQPPTKDPEFQPTIKPQETGFPDSQTVVPEPVDLVKLGNSLFRTGNYDRSIRSYQARLDQENDPAEQSWLKLMIACNHRLLGQLDQAESLFREVSNLRSAAPFVAQHARWSLKMIERRRVMKAEADQLQATLELLTSESDQ